MKTFVRFDGDDFELSTVHSIETKNKNILTGILEGLTTEDEDLLGATSFAAWNAAVPSAVAEIVASGTHSVEAGSGKFMLELGVRMAGVARIDGREKGMLGISPVEGVLPVEWLRCVQTLYFLVEAHDATAEVAEVGWSQQEFQIRLNGGIFPNHMRIWPFSSLPQAEVLSNPRFPNTIYPFIRLPWAWIDNAVEPKLVGERMWMPGKGFVDLTEMDRNQSEQGE